MTARVYNLERGSVHEAFAQSRAIVQVFGGGWGNGKTTAAIVLKVLLVAKDYPGANILVSRATYPRLNDTIRKEFYAWCPPAWIKRRHTKDDNTVYLHNGTVINFRYVQQKGAGKSEETTSNLLSATYDLIVVDQMEDPEYTEKDFDDLMGRRRGQTAYVGSDPTMPRTGPRWLIIMCNPTRNWVFTKLIRPIMETQRTGTPHADLLVDEDGKPIIELFEGPSSINARNLPDDYFTGLKASLSKRTYDRMVGGQWVGYEGLVYPDWDRTLNMLPREHMVHHMHSLTSMGFKVAMREGYDFGIAEPACYGLWFFDHHGNAFLLDGFYEKELDIPDQVLRIQRIRMLYGFVPGPNHAILADPSIFKRYNKTKLVGESIAGLMIRDGLQLERGNNAIVNGVVKLQGYIKAQEARAHPIYMTVPSPRLFVADELDWFGDEIEDYYWAKTPAGEPLDKPVDRNNHAMDMARYTFTHQAPILGLTGVYGPQRAPWSKWHVVPQGRETRVRHRAFGGM